MLVMFYSVIIMLCYVLLYHAVLYYITLVAHDEHNKT
jgi:hypothetical protein